MDAMDMFIIKEWHEGSDGLILMDRIQCNKGLELKTLLAKRGRFCQDWLLFVYMAFTLVHTQVKETEEMEHSTMGQPFCIKDGIQARGWQRTNGFSGAERSSGPC
jgi:hypothetical protein